MLPDIKMVRMFFRREVDELAEHRETIPPSLALPALVAFSRAIEADGVRLAELFTTSEGFLAGERNVEPVAVESLEVAHERREQLVVDGVALVKIRWLGNLPAGLLVSRHQETGEVSLGFAVPASRSDRLSEVVEWFRRLMEEHNPLKGTALALSDDGSVEFLPPQEVTREDIVLPAEVLDGLERDMDFLDEPAAYPPHLRSRSVILAGEPGLGKTLACRWLSSRYPATTLWVTPSAVQAVGPASIFRTARALRPTLVILEDLDLASGDRRGGPLGDILCQLDGFGELLDVAVVATTNNPEILDEALDPRTRPGRFHRLVFLERPETELRERIVTRLIQASSKLRPAGEPLLQRLVEATAGMTPAQITQLVADLELDVLYKERHTGGTVDPLQRVDTLAGARRGKAAFGFATEAA